eukprot:2073546-Rhodomonas_salina.1
MYLLSGPAVRLGGPALRRVSAGTSPCAHQSLLLHNMNSSRQCQCAPDTCLGVSGACSAAPPGFYGSGGVCAPCPGRSVTLGEGTRNASGCLCPAGHVADVAGDCVPCLRGTFAAVGSTA